MSAQQVVTLSRYVTVDRVAWALDRAGAHDADDVRVVVESNAFLRPTGLAYLAQWARARHVAGRPATFAATGAAGAYMARMDFFEWAGAPAVETRKRPEVGRFIPILALGGAEDINRTHNAICDLLLGQFDEGPKLIEAFEWCVYELLDNVLNHAQLPFPAAVCAQPAGERLEICVVDSGRGLLSSLSEGHAVADHAEALSLALTRGVTRGTGQGNGLAGTDTVLRANGGAMRLWSGDRLWKCKAGDAAVEALPCLPGTGVGIEFRMDRAVALADTWIGGSGWGFLDCEAERIADAGGMKVLEQCANTGTRDAARVLRRRLAALLPQMERPLVLDFAGVRTASSSFLDELLGPLRLELGERFADRIHLRGMSELVRRVANGVAAQRDAGQPAGNVVRLPGRDATQSEWLVHWEESQQVKTCVWASRPSEAREIALAIRDGLADAPTVWEELSEAAGSRRVVGTAVVPLRGGEYRVEVHVDHMQYADTWSMRRVTRSTPVRECALTPIAATPDGQELYAADAVAGALGISAEAFIRLHIGLAVPRSAWIYGSEAGFADLYTDAQVQAIVAAYREAAHGRTKAGRAALLAKLAGEGEGWLKPGAKPQVVGARDASAATADERSSPVRRPWSVTWAESFRYHAVLPSCDEVTARGLVARLEGGLQVARNDASAQGTSLRSLKVPVDHQVVHVRCVEALGLEEACVVEPVPGPFALQG